MEPSRELTETEQRYVDEVWSAGKNITLGELNELHDELLYFIRSGSGRVKVVLVYEGNVVHERNSMMFSSSSLKHDPEAYRIALKFLYLHEPHDEGAAGLEFLLREVNRLLPRDCLSIITSDQDSKFRKEMMENNEKLTIELKALDARREYLLSCLNSIPPAAPPKVEESVPVPLWKRIFG